MAPGVAPCYLCDLEPERRHSLEGDCHSSCTAYLEWLHAAKDEREWLNRQVSIDRYNADWRRRNKK